MPEAPKTISRQNKVVIATTVALSFISLWRASAIVLSDLASSMFYAGGIAVEAIGRSAPWFILGVMLFGLAVRAVYTESCSMYVRGGVYVVVRDSMGPFLAKISVSALIFDYLLTGPISSVSAGHYIAGLINETYSSFHKSVGVAGMHELLNPNWFSLFFAVVITIYFWRSNTRGIQESSKSALHIIQVTTVMILLMLIWCAISLLLRDKITFPPLPVPSNLHFNEEALGWFRGTFWITLTPIAIMVAFGHSFLAMSGFETLAQVYRELAYPKLRNLKTTGIIIFVYSVISTGIITLLAFMIIPESTPLAEYKDNLIAALVMHLDGPYLLKLLMHAFVVVVGAMILSGAVNTSMIGANAILNRVAEDRVLVDWFRQPHRKYGTTFRLINLVTILQILTIILSGGDVYLLGEAYAFGVIWSFFMKSCGVLALRVQRKDQEYKVPFNIRIGRFEIPVGLGLITAVLFLVGVANLFTKQVATIYGITFTIVLFILFSVSEKINKRKHAAHGKVLEKFNLDHQPEIAVDTIDVKPGSTLVAVRHQNSLAHLKWVLDTSKSRHRNIVVATIRPVSVGEAEYELSEEQYFSSHEQEIFSKVVEMAEKAGKHVDLVVIPAVSPYDGLVQTAQNLRSSFLITGASLRMPKDELARRIGLAWERLPEPRHPFSLVIVGPEQEPLYFTLGPHMPRLWPEDVDILHQLWLDLSDREGLGAKIHHRDVVGLALRHLKKELEDKEEHQDVLDELDREIKK